MTSTEQFFQRGWQVFSPEDELLDWVEQAREPAHATAQNPEFAAWHRCAGTWFVGVNALPNDPMGRLGGGPELSGRAMKFVREALQFADRPLDRAQVSIIYPGYPQPQDGESAVAFDYRLNRDAAHVDGLHPVGATRARHQQEFQAFLLGIPITDASPNAAPLVVWEGSHHVLAAMYRAAFSGLDPADWSALDLTKVYHAARKRVFETCARKVVHVAPGGAYVIHRFALHGVAPFADGAVADPKGRAILYFRPETERQLWLDLD